MRQHVILQNRLVMSDAIMYFVLLENTKKNLFSKYILLLTLFCMQ